MLAALFLLIGTTNGIAQPQSSITLLNRLNGMAYQNCQISGHTQQYIMLQCQEKTILLNYSQLSELENEIIVEEIDTENCNKTILSSNLLVQLRQNITDNLQYNLNATYLYYGYQNGIKQHQIYSIPQQDYEYINYDVTTIDELLSVVTLVLKKQNENQLVVQNWLVYPFKKLESEKKFRYSSISCDIKQFQQYFNKNKNSLIMFILCDNQLIVTEAFLRNNTFIYQKVNEYIFYATNFTLIKNYLLLTFQNFQQLFYIEPYTNSLILLQEFDSQPIQLIELEQNQVDIVIIQMFEKKINIFHGIKQNNWQQPIKIIFLQTLFIPSISTALYTPIDQAIYVYSNQNEFINLYPLCLQGYKMDIAITGEKDKHLTFNKCELCTQIEQENLDIYSNFERAYEQLDTSIINSQHCLIDCDFLKQNPQSDSQTYQYCTYDQCNKFQTDLNIFFRQSIIYQVQLMSKEFETKYFENYNQLNQVNISIDQLKSISQNFTDIDIIHQLKDSDTCTQPCDLIYQNTELPLLTLQNTTLVSFSGECFIQELIEPIVYSCLQYKECYLCQRQIGCYWEENRCEYQQKNAQIDLSSPYISSQWHYQKSLVCEYTDICNYNQTQFHSHPYLNYSNIFVKAGQVCSWYFEAQDLSMYKFHLKTKIKQQNAKAEICVGIYPEYLCEPHALSDGFAPYIYTFASYFRYTVQFEEDLHIDNLEIQVNYYQPASIFEKLKQALVQILIYIGCGIFIIISLCYLARRRLQILIGQPYEFEYDRQLNQLLPLSTSRLTQVMQSMIDQEIVAKYPQDESLVLYGDSSCPFCMENYEISDVVAQLFCGHLFHYDCFENWVKYKGSLDKCPICNQKVDYFLANKELFATIKTQQLSQKAESAILK